MAFYKLFYIVHRRTDWVTLYRWQRECIMPEWYEEKREQARIAATKLLCASMLVHEAASNL